jgi:hypothetical protein
LYKYSEEYFIDMPAVSRAQQRFFGMVRAAQKGEMSNPSPEVAQAASSMKKKDVKDFASTKHKKLPEKKMSEEFDYLFEDLDVTTLTEEDIIDLIEKKIPSSKRAKIARAVADRLPPGRTSSKLRLYALEKDLEKQKNRKFTKADSHQGITSAPKNEMRTFQDFMAIIESIDYASFRKRAKKTQQKIKDKVFKGREDNKEKQKEKNEEVDWNKSDIGKHTGQPIPKKRMSAAKRHEMEKERRANLGKKPGDKAGDSALVRALRRKAQDTGNYAD